MGITLLSGPANSGKAQVVMDAVRRHVARGQEPLLVVPTRADAEHYLRELAGDRAAVGVRVERFGGLLEEVARRAGLTEPPLGSLARARVLDELAAERAAGSGFARALGELIAELRVNRVTPVRLQRAVAAWAAADGPQSARTELGELFGAYAAALQRLGRVDAEQRAVRALDALRRAPALWGRTPVLVYGFDDLTRLQIDTIETLGRVLGRELTVSLTFEAGRTAFAGRAGTFAMLAPLAEEHRQLEPRVDYYAPAARVALSHLERRLFEPDAPPVDPAGCVLLLEGAGERAEVELVAGEISRLLAGGMAAEEIAVVTRSSPAGEDLLEEVFTRAGIPVALQRRRRFTDSSIGRALVGLLRCVPEASGEDGPGELADLLAWLRAPGLLDRLELADALELHARRAGSSSAAGARRLWEERHWPLEAIDRLWEAQSRGTAALLERARHELERLFRAPRRGRAALLGAEELEDAGALAEGMRAIEQLRDLALAAPELCVDGAAELADALEGLELLSGERPAPGAVAVLDPLALRARRVRALFLCGLQEGVFPAPARPNPFLAEEERRRLAESSGLVLGAQPEALAAERYLLYAAVSRPQELLFLSWHVADDDGEPTARSLFVDDVCDLFEPALFQRRARRPPGASERSRAPAAPGRGREASERLTDPVVLAGLAAHVWSASSLEVWISCPVRWFVERLLRPGAFEPDAEPLARGGLAHAALKDTLEGLRARTGSARVSPARLELARELLGRALAQREREFPLSSAPERRPGVRRRLRADLERYLEHAAQASGDLEPTHLELGFGFGPEDDRGEPSELPALELGRGVRMRGRIDRVDVDEDGQAVVYDYKGRTCPPAARWAEEGTLQVALYMRAVESLLGLSAAGGFYQPLVGADLRARGVLDRDSGVELECVRGDLLEHEAVRELLEQAGASALQAAGEAARGELEPRPRTCGYQGSGCMYPAICRCEG